MAKVARLRAIERMDGRPKRWGISVPVPGKPARRVYFASKGERDRELARLKRLVELEGVAAAAVSAKDARVLSEVRGILPPDVDLREVARFWVENHVAREERCLADAVEEYLETMRVRGLSADYISHSESELRRMRASVGGARMVSEIGGRELVAFLGSLPFAPQTVENYREHFARFFRWCVQRGFCMRSPMDGLAAIKVAESEPNVMPVEDVAAFFAEAEASFPQAAPFFALSFFAGLRSSQIPRLGFGDISFDERGILLPGATHKTGKRFYVEGFEANLWAWLEPLRRRENWPGFGNSTFRDWRERCYLRARIEYPHNGARDSFCSYHVALHNDASRTATLLTHRGVNMLYSHYRGKATRRDAERYFQILPQG